jgi:hypothetical protein
MPHELGFGTEYEKFVLRDVAKKIVQELSIKSVCEYPSNSLMGDNSEIFSDQTLQTTKLTRPHRNTESKSDLVWNFCEIEQQREPSELINEMLSLTKRYLLIITQNRRNPGIPLHWVYHVLVGKKWDHGRFSLMTPKPLIRILSRYGKIIRVGYFDVPWFILDIYESGVILRRLIPKSFSGSMLGLKKSRFEELPTRYKQYLAHHAYILFEKANNQHHF